MIKAEKKSNILNDRYVWIIELDNVFDIKKTLLISKVSEAILPNKINNHIGEGGTFNDFLSKQKNVKFIINGGFNHYKKDFYEWRHQSFNVGDPVGLVKIREHYYEDFYHIENYGFFVQNKKHEPWKIIKYNELKKDEKYILGCTPLLIYNKEKCLLPADLMKPISTGKINPPSILWHGLQNHPRTAVGIKNNKIIFVLVEGNKKDGGCTLLELQEIGLKLKLDYFLNLDGGGSSQFKLKLENTWIENEIDKNDKERILGHVIVFFEKE